MAVKHVFLLEQDENLAVSCRDALEGEGNRVTWAARSEALSLLSESAFDLVIYDIAFENIDISRLFHLARTKNRLTEFLILTPEPWSASLERTFCFRVRDYLVSPFHIEELKVKVHRILHSSMHLLSPESGPVLISSVSGGAFPHVEASRGPEGAPRHTEGERGRSPGLLEWISMSRAGDPFDSHITANLDLLLVFAGEWFGAVRGSILLKDATGNGFYLARGRGVPPRLTGERVKLPEGSVTSIVAGTKQPLLIRDFRESGKFRSSRSSYCYHTSMSCPLMDGDEMLGMIHLSEPRGGLPFTRSELEQFTALADTMVRTLKELARGFVPAR